MNSSFILLMTIVIAGVTILIRFLPFLIFGHSEKTPEFISYLGRVLPGAIIGMLVVYCLKGVSFASYADWLPALIAVASIIVLHVWKRNSLLSILGGTVIYIILLNYVFV